MRHRKDRENTPLGPRAGRAIAQFLQLSETTLSSGLLHIELNGNRQAIVEGSGGVLEYSTECIRMSGSGTMVRFRGRGLAIGELDRSGIVISGLILSVEFVM
ncbi:MAG: YabP/YqfC family sporulation protein [Oscillospiraceae bacterium]